MADIGKLGKLGKHGKVGIGKLGNHGKLGTNLIGVAWSMVKSLFWALGVYICIYTVLTHCIYIH